MRHVKRPGLAATLSLCLSALLVAGCAPQFSPNTYSSNAVQLANKVEGGVVIGYREVSISASGNIGTVTGGAAGGVLGIEYANSGLVAVGATAVGGLIGNALDHAAGDTTGWEYIVRKPNGDMLSVTQRERRPLGLGQKVLVIMGPQARVIPDYSVIPEPVVAAAPPPIEEKKPDAPVKVEVVLSLPPGVTVQPVSVPEATTPPAAATPDPELQAQGPTQFPSMTDLIAGLGLTPVAALTPQGDIPLDKPSVCALDSDGVCAAEGRMPNEDPSATLP